MTQGRKKVGIAGGLFIPISKGENRRGRGGRMVQVLLIQSSLVMGLLCTGAFAKKTVVPFNEEERIVVKISNKSMNRLSVEGDRIQEVIGLNDSVSVEKDGNHGHMFLKVPENSSEKIEVTLITEGGLVQDLTLQPIEQSSTTLILKTGEGEPSSSSSSPSSKHPKKAVPHQKPEALIPSAHLSNTSYQDALIEFMKALYLGAFEDSIASHGERRTPPGVSVSFSRGFAKNSFLCEAHDLRNNTAEPIDLHERDFFQNGDIAIALGNPLLKAGQKTTLYLVRKDS